MPGVFDDSLAGSRRAVVTALADFLDDASSQEASRLLRVRGPLLERALAASSRLAEGSAPVLEAWRRYNGVVWSHLEPASLVRDDLARILVPSALYGLNAASDEICDYRLTFKVVLPPLGGLATFWRPALKEALSALDGATLINLLPKEHAAALPDLSQIPVRVVSVSFRRADGEGVVGHDAKAVKGVLARRVVEDGVEVIDGFRWRGWRGREREGRYEIRAPKTRQPTRH